MWDWEYAVDILPRLLGALQVTVTATALAGALALFCGLAIALVREARIPVLSATVSGVAEFVRATPLLIQLYFLFFLLPEYGLELSAFATGVIGLGIHYSAFTAEVYRAGFLTVPRGQFEAGNALHLPTHLAWRLIVIPQAVRSVLPVLANYVIVLFKDTSILATIAVVEVLAESRQAANESYRFLEPLTLAAVLYLVLSLVAVGFLGMLQRRLDAGGVRTL